MSDRLECQISVCGRTEEEVMTVLEKLMQESGKTIVDIAANAELAKKLAAAEKRVAELEARIKELNADVWDLKLTPLPKSDPTTAVVSEPIHFEQGKEVKV